MIPALFFFCVWGGGASCLLDFICQQAYACPFFLFSLEQNTITVV